MSAQLHKIIRDNFQLTADYHINSQTQFTRDLDADSFQLVLLACEIEDAFQIDIHDKFLDEIDTVGALELLITELVAKDCLA